MKQRENINFENGHLSDEAVAMYADAILEQRLSSMEENVMVHVSECTQCKDKVLDITTFLRNPESISAGHMLYGEKQTSRKKWFAYPMRIAALFFTAVVLAGSYFFLNDAGTFPFKDLVEPDITSTHESRTIKAQSEKIEMTGAQKSTPTKQISKPPVKRVNNTSFKTNPTLESMIGSSFRSATYEVFSPRNNAVVGDQVHFKWRNQKPGSALILKIVNNRNEPKIEYNVAGNGFIFKEKDKLPPGLYYWKLATQDDLLYIGKFIVK